MRSALLTLLAMVAFAANSLLCRLALRETGIDPASFTALRLCAGAASLWLLLRWQGKAVRSAGSWLSALALFSYAAAFSFAYLELQAGTGALLLFVAVQLTMVGFGLWFGERLNLRQWLGLAIALLGLVALLSPGMTAPPAVSALLMALAGISWGVYSLLGRRCPDPVAAIAGSFLRAVPFALLLIAASLTQLHLETSGVLYALLSGALASGVGYIVWYAALRELRITQAAIVQLSVPVITALAAVPLLGETITPRLVMASLAILGGIAWTTIASYPRH